MQKGFYIVSQLLRRPWAIDARYAEANKTIPYRLLNGMAIDTESDAKQDKRSIPFLVQDARKPYSYSYTDWSEAPEGSIAVIPIIGPLMKYDVEECGMITIGMASIGRSIQDAADNPNISSIILYVDTPGGTVDGTQALAELIKKVDQQKPVISFVDGQMCSAGMWIGSHSRYIILENSSTEAGSIGVCYSFFDELKRLEAEGITFHYIVPEESQDKNAPFMEALKGEYKLLIDTELKPLVYMFRDAVRKGRGNVSDEAMTGKVFFAEEAIRLNLADEIGSFQRAVEKASELATSPQSKSSKNKKSKKMKKLTHLIALLGLEAIEISEGAESVAFTIEQLEAAETSLEQMHGQIQQLTTDLGTANDDLGTAQGTIKELQTAAGKDKNRITELEGTVSQQKTRIEELEADPEITSVPKDGDDDPESGAKDTLAQSMKKKFLATSGAEK